MFCFGQVQSLICMVEGKKGSLEAYNLKPNKVTQIYANKRGQHRVNIKTLNIIAENQLIADKQS